MSIRTFLINCGKSRVPVEISETARKCIELDLVLWKCFLNLCVLENNKVASKKRSGPKGVP
jgi:hypothetical protein